MADGSTRRCAKPPGPGDICTASGASDCSTTDLRELRDVVGSVYHPGDGTSVNVPPDLTRRLNSGDATIADAFLTPNQVQAERDAQAYFEEAMKDPEFAAEVDRRLREAYGTSDREAIFSQRFEEEALRDPRPIVTTGSFGDYAEFDRLTPGDQERFFDFLRDNLVFSFDVGNLFGPGGYDPGTSAFPGGFYQEARVAAQLRRDQEGALVLTHPLQAVLP